MAEVVSEGEAFEDGQAHARLLRLQRAFLDRDWIAIAIELVVVTLGVLLAFEAQQLGEKLSRQRDEREFLERLYRETGAGEQELIYRVSTHRRGVTELGAVLRAEHDAATLARYARQDDFGCVLGTLPTAGYNDTASEELIASGRIGTISDPDLRSAVRELAAFQAEGQQQLAYGRQTVNSMMSNFLPFYRNELKAGENDTRCTIDWPKLFSDPAAAAAVARAYRVQYLMLSIRQDTLSATQRVRRKLECELKKPRCARHAA